MFIEIAQDIFDEILNAGQNKQSALDVLEQLCYAYKYRKHIVFIEHINATLIGQLHACCGDRKMIFHFLSQLNSKKRDIKALKNYLCITALVTFKKDTSIEANCIVINPNQKPRFEFWEETHFLTENLSDSKFYKCIVKYYLRNSKIDNRASFKFYPLNGGGGTTKDILQYEKDCEEHFCLAIADSDKKFHAGNIGQTADGVCSICNDTPFNCSFYILNNVSEIENLIPLGILKMHSNTQQKNFLDQGYDLSYYDIKEGKMYYRLFDEACYNYWRPILNGLDWSVIDQGRNTSDYESYKIDVNNLPPLPNWGKTILNDIINDSHNFLLYENVNINDLSINQRIEWNHLGQLIYSWTCCSNGLRL